MSRHSLILVFFVLLFILHQDFWWRDDPRLVLGMLPVSLAYHVFWTVLVAMGWFLVTKFCWPHELDAEPASAHATPATWTPPEGAPRSLSHTAGGTQPSPEATAGRLPALPGKADELTAPDRPPR